MDLKELGWDDHFETSWKELSLQNIKGITLGRISFYDGNSYTILTENAEIRGRPTSKVQGEVLPAVGDWTVVKLTETANMIIKVLPRKGCISRKVPGKASREQVIAANIDLVFIVMGLDRDFNLRRLERYLVMVSASGAQPVILLNKSDMVDDQEEKGKLVKGIAGNIPVYNISALSGQGLDIMGDHLFPGVTAALVGSSGVGKSTLINRLLREERLRTGEVRRGDGKGKHVTTSRELIVIPGGGIIIDNPGIRELQLWGGENMLDEAFPDIFELSWHCRFKDCQHVSEPDCEVKKALEAGEMDRSRYDNYIKMRKELKHLSLKTDKGAQAEERSRWRAIMKDVKHYQRYKRNGK
ncbi:MAG: ribosome small subunit-dependent GTPase A [Thermoplasmatota archaeon]